MAESIKSDVEEILESEFPSQSIISMQKYKLPSKLKSQTEKQVQQKFFKDYIYLWKICSSDSIAGYALLDNTYGKSLPITFLVIFSPDGEIRRMDIIRYREPYGGAIASRRWLDQFIGKSADHEFKVDKDVDSISGATISVLSVTRAAHKLVLILNQLITKNSFECSQEKRQKNSVAK
jgi:Na+-translocating ferredoxin:NAD+ oxidoreductase RnfG subunit